MDKKEFGKELCRCKSSIILVLGRTLICILAGFFFFYNILLTIRSLQGDLIDITFYVIGCIVICFAICFVIYEMFDRMKIYEVILYEEGITVKKGKKTDQIHFDEINLFRNSRVKTFHYFDIVLIEGRQEIALFSFSVLEIRRWHNFVVEVKDAYKQWFETDRGSRRRIFKKRFWYESPATNFFGKEEDYV